MGLGTSLLAGSAYGQTRSTVAQERNEFTAWLTNAPLSPKRAVVVRPVGPLLSIGPDDADVPLAGIGRGQLTERDGRVMLQLNGETRPLARGRPISLGAWQLLASGPPGRAAVTAFARVLRPGKSPAWFPYDPAMVFVVRLVPPKAPGIIRVLGADGVEVDATESGTVSFDLGEAARTLRVLRLPGANGEESELEIYFTDPTNGAGSYPSGRFVTLIPGPGASFLLDLNRARNPFCAYNTVFPCPAPWRGNGLGIRVKAGERYEASP